MIGMTREEAITILQEKYDYCKSFYDLAAHPEEDYPEMAKYLQALQIALSALRPVSREQVEKMKKEPVEGGYDELYAPTYKCPECGVENTGRGNFCQSCGCPYTDEAVEMVMERLEALFGERNDD